MPPLRRNGVLSDRLIAGKRFYRPEDGASHGGDVDVVVPPQHTLWHAGGATGVEDEEVVAGRHRHAGGRRRGRSDRLVVDGAREQRVAGLVGHLDQHAQRRQPVADGSDVRGELGVVDQRGGAGVQQQVEQLFLHVAVVHVHRGDPGAIAGNHRLEVLVAVAQVDAEVVLTRLVPGEVSPFGVAAQALLDEVVGDPVDPTVELGVGQPEIAPDHHLLVRDGARDGVDDGREVEAGELGHGAVRSRVVGWRSGHASRRASTGRDQASTTRPLSGSIGQVSSVAPPR